MKREKIQNYYFKTDMKNILYYVVFSRIYSQYQRQYHIQVEPNEFFPFTFLFSVIVPIPET